jgi:hypothetical protein
MKLCLKKVWILSNKVTIQPSSAASRPFIDHGTEIELERECNGRLRFLLERPERIKKLRRGHVEVKKPWQDERENHTSKQEIKEAMAMPKSSSFCWRSSCCDCGCWWSCIVAAITHSLCCLFTWSMNIPCNRMTNFTSPIEILKTN